MIHLSWTELYDIDTYHLIRKSLAAAKRTTRPHCDENKFSLHKTLFIGDNINNKKNKINKYIFIYIIYNSNSIKTKTKKSVIVRLCDLKKKNVMIVNYFNL